MTCPQCRQENGPGAKFCSECGTRLPVGCPACGVEVAETAKFCSSCGQALQGSATAAGSRSRIGNLAPRIAEPQALQPGRTEASSAPHETASAERRQLTVMFCDLVAFTPLSQRLDPEELREIVRAHQEACSEVIRHFDGHLASTLPAATLACVWRRSSNGNRPSMP